jgi:zinc transporter
LAGEDHGLLWGLAFGADGPREIGLDAPARPGEFCWLHLNLADNGARVWLEGADLPEAVRGVLLGPETHQRALVADGVVACVLHDIRREFERRYSDRVGALRVALTDDLIVTARLHPLGCADILRQRLAAHGIDGPSRALDALSAALIENVEIFARTLAAEVEAGEDDFLAGRAAPSGRALLESRRRLGLLHRLVDGAHRVFHRLEHDADLPAALLPAVETISQRLQAHDGDLLALLAQLRGLREEIELQANQRINQNLYLLSIVTALLMPATLVTGIFGMNTGELPFTGSGGTWVALGLGGASSLATYLVLRKRGFFR